jgi:hypothetical protein
LVVHFSERGTTPPGKKRALEKLHKMAGLHRWLGGSTQFFSFFFFFGERCLDVNPWRAAVAGKRATNLATDLPIFYPAK